MSCVSPTAPAGEMMRGSSALSSRMSAWTRSAGTLGGPRGPFHLVPVRWRVRDEPGAQVVRVGCAPERVPGARTKDLVRGPVIAQPI